MFLLNFAENITTFKATAELGGIPESKVNLPSAKP